MNVDKWGGRLLPDYTTKDIPNIQKILPHGWVTSDENKVDWKSVLKM
jgi:hypothetical protein